MSIYKAHSVIPVTTKHRRRIQQLCKVYLKDYEVLQILQHPETSTLHYAMRKKKGSVLRDSYKVHWLDLVLFILPEVMFPDPDTKQPLTRPYCYTVMGGVFGSRHPVDFLWSVHKHRTKISSNNVQQEVKSKSKTE